MHITRGSTWNRWDFHVHTPYSILNNQYGFSPDPDYKKDVEEFDKYVKILFTNAVEKEIVAIGVTDYFSIDGYKRIREEYLSKPEKMSELFPDDEIRSKVEQLYVFPNIELRLDTFVGNDEHSVNYHVIFSGEIECSLIEERFLQRLSLCHHTGTALPLRRSSILQLGNEYKQNNPRETREDYLVGLEKATIHHTDIIDALKSSNDLADKYFLSIPVDEDLSTLKWEGRSSEIRRLLYHQCHFLMSSNAGTRKFALAEGHEEEQIREFGSIKPCIWGSDAHSYERMFSPDDNRFCWIKAEPTFEGLQQILYEPADRVKIQKKRPEEKDEHYLIDYIIFHDYRFEEAPIYLSEGLTAIIGGKSTGKSILLRHIAKSIDPRQVQRKEEKTHVTQKLEADAEVFWKDGVSGERKIIYIPQSWLNRVADEDGGDTQLNSMIREILLQQPTIHSAHSELESRIEGIRFKTKKNIEEYVSHITRADSCEKELIEFGRSNSFLSSIKKLEKQRGDLSIEAGINDEVLEKYNTVEKQISEQKEQLSLISKEEMQIEFINKPFLYIPEITQIEFDNSVSYDLDTVPSVKELLEQTINQINEQILVMWLPAIQKASNVLSNKKNNISNSLTGLNSTFGPLKDIVAKNDQLKAIENQLKVERQKLQRAKEIEQEKAEHLQKAGELRKQILESRQILYTAYVEFSEKLAEINSSETELFFEGKIEDRRKELFEAIYGLFDNRNLRSFRGAVEYSLVDAESFKIDEGLFDFLWKGMSSGSLGFRGGNNTQSVLEKLFSDWFYIHYVVKSGNDTINSMSPGKKALVLLELIVNLEKGNCPILIDQPEDDLDNRSIYTDLVKYIKDKKHERQIIVVTHNANVVVGADAEEVIIANQDGKEAENYSKRFEYRCGAIENVDPVKESDGEVRKGILNQKGIQEQICDILEGGKDAFEKRASKYFSAM